MPRWLTIAQSPSLKPTVIPGSAASAARAPCGYRSRCSARIPMLSAMTLDQLSAKMRCENRRLKLVQPKLGQFRSQGSPLQRGLKRLQENATDDAVLWGVSDHIVPHGSCPESLPVGFCGVNFGRLGFAERWVLLFDLARRNKAAGLETAAACNRCDAVLWSRAWRSEPCVDRLACLAGANDVRTPVAVSDNDPTRRPKTGTIDHADQDSLAVKTFNCDPGCRGARPLLTRQHAATPLHGMPFRMIAAAAAVPKYANRKSDAMMTATRAASSRGDCRAIRASNACCDICCPRWNLGCVRGWGTRRRQEKSHRLESAAFSLVGR